ncbi:aromatic amino acid lyase [Dongia sedimenti]|uniref:Aromatic amino acid lyase n=1 Tax=Dongia sedimenti TaxID=3064282 RepID=A0ABU0YFW3_9PROT|nr:aromatic amino acid lyase [Rhodospirillaceae bacterium R-7]
MVTLTRRSDITLNSFEAVAWRGEGVQLAPDALARIADARSAFMRLIEDPAITIYGVTSGYGSRAGQRLKPEDRKRHAAQPNHGTAATFGEPFPKRVTRGFVLARLANLLEGHAAVRPKLAEAVAAMLDQGSLPDVPSIGNSGAGEILALGHLFAALGERVGLEEKEHLALINGSPCAAALIADAALASRKRIEIAKEIFALSAEAFKAPLEAYDAALETLWQDPAESEALTAIRTLIAGGSTERRPYQAPVSFRIVPRILGRAIRARDAAIHAAEVSLSSVTDNPVYIPPGDDALFPNGRVLSNGGYHNSMAAPALDDLAAGWADLCTLAERQSAKLLDAKVSLLPESLRADPDDPRELIPVPMVAVGLGERARHAAQRSFLPGAESGGFGQNDVGVASFLAWQKEATAGRAFDGCLAILGLIAAEALDVTRRAVPPALQARLAFIRRHAPPITTLRALGPDLGRLSEAITLEIFGRAA